MLGFAERFPMQVTRQGNVASRHHFSVKCSKCANDYTLESKARIPDHLVAQKMERRGWLLGKRRADDICPQCLADKKAPQLADKFKVTRDGEPVKPQSEATAELLDKHFPQAEPPKPDKPERHTERKTSHAPFILQTGMSPELSIALAHSIATLNSTMASLTGEIGDMRAAIELTVEQNTQFIAQNDQLIRAIAQIVPAIIRGNEALASRLDTLERQTPRPALHVEPPAPQPEPQAEAASVPAQPEPESRPHRKPVPVVPHRVEPVAHKERPHVQKGEAYLNCCQPPSGKGAYFTTINISADVGEACGFGLGTRVKVERDGDVITLTKTDDQNPKQSIVWRLPSGNNKNRLTTQTFKLGATYQFSRGATIFKTKPGQLVIKAVKA